MSTGYREFIEKYYHYLLYKRTAANKAAVPSYLLAIQL